LQKISEVLYTPKTYFLRVTSGIYGIWTMEYIGYTIILNGILVYGDYNLKS